VVAELRRRKVDLLHGLDGSAAVLTRALARRAGLGYLLSSYSVDDAWRLGDAGRGASGVLAASEPIRQALISHGAAPPGRIHLMRPGVYHVRRATCFSDPDHSTAIVAGGTLDDQPAMEAVLLCFCELVARKLDCVFFIMGAGRSERRLRRRAEELNLRHHLTFTGCPPMGELTGIFQAADVYVAATGQDQIDMRSLLAMAAGVPVLAAGGDGVSDFLRDGETVMSFTPGDAGELTVKLAMLLDDRASARALADSAIQYIHDNHSPAANVAALARICRQSAAEPVTVT
jgi:glycosyltransferase involved in cell wall biosynthesis